MRNQEHFNDVINELTFHATLNVDTEEQISNYDRPSKPTILDEFILHTTEDLLVHHDIDLSDLLLLARNYELSA